MAERHFTGSVQDAGMRHRIFCMTCNTKGVHSAKVGERASKLKATIFMLDKVDAATVAKLTAMQSDFPGSELTNVPCGLTR